MRVIAGICKGRRLAAVPGQSTRPTSDKVKESIFNMIGPFFEEGHVLDAYAGTGALAIEALSRGMETATCIDIEPKSLHVIKKNLAECGFLTQAEVYRNDAKRAISILAKKDKRYDLVFLDPPYRYDTIPELISQLQEQRLVNDRAKIVAEHDAGVRLPDEIGEFVQIRYVVYGDTGVTIYQKKTEE
ncbi:16S rRNA (guanine(966)-N(2))-methyltransferase RsmD [Fodinisporobacter ferrooxydans]|uniref:16S rRNA (Guanine(966)-N(2))-methyltransferase RsmD n=1 Tax=Fodinisporobacter ferrooxydans TaxID=2901836 RepID=A0ABY4CFA7_9BACL|nr:16S rRNA (guanine(966)-N(2))-methyltransferase RsmD [Alicyclobacillaceae bacterium MYW30-H2]